MIFAEDAAVPTSGASPSVAAAPGTHRGSTTSRRLSDADRLLLETMETGRDRVRHTGRFLTMHKRRRKRLTTRSLNQEPGILDDIFHGQVQVKIEKQKSIIIHFFIFFFGTLYVTYFLSITSSVSFKNLDAGGSTLSHWKL